MFQHFADTRTAQGRVRFLMGSADAAQPGVVLIVEGQGWQRQERFDSLDEAALALALDGRVPQALYVQALDDLHRQLAFFGQHGFGQRGAA